MFSSSFAPRIETIAPLGWGREYTSILINRPSGRSVRNERVSGGQGKGMASTGSGEDEGGDGLK
jgi:hypothetical protein